MIRKKIRLLFVMLLTAALAACGGKKVTVEIPPQIDLTTLGTIGVIAFEVQSDRQVPGDITLHFIQHLQAAQPGVPILELGDQDKILHEVGFGALDTEAVKAIGNKHAVDTLLTGTLEVTHSLPDVKFGQDLTSMSAATFVRGNLNARLRQTSNGATVWSNGAHGKWKMAGLDIAAGSPASIGISNVEDKYQKMLQELARVGTADFRVRYETHKIRE